MMLKVQSFISKTILFISLSIILVSCSHSDLKKDDLESRLAFAVSISNWQEMLILADQLLQHKPNDSEVNLRKAQALSELNRPEEALVFVKKSIKFAPRKYRLLGFTYFIKGNCFEALERYEEAIESYRLADKLGYGDSDVYCAIYRMRVKLDLFDEEPLF